MDHDKKMEIILTVLIACFVLILLSIMINPPELSMRIAQLIIFCILVSFAIGIAIKDRDYQFEHEYRIVLMENDAPVAIVRYESTAKKWCEDGNRDNDKRTPFVFCHYAKFNTGSIPKHTRTEEMK